MLIDFFFTLKDAKVPVSIKEFLVLLEALQKNVIAPSLDDFYYLARATLVKDESHYDKFDKAFGLYFHGIEAIFEKTPEIPLEWLEKRLQRELTDEQRAAIEKLGYDKLMERLKELLDEQKERHEGGNRWIGTGGTSPFGNGGENPEGIRIGGKGGNRTAVKVWEARSYRDYDDERELAAIGQRLAEANRVATERERIATELEAAQEKARASLSADRAELEQRLGEARRARETKARAVPRNLLSRYDRIRSRKRVHAVFPLRGDSCGNCDTMLPLQRRSVMSGTGGTDVCEECGVMLYATD